MTELNEEAVQQVMLAHAKDGRVALSIQDIALMVGLSRWATSQATNALLAAGRLVILEVPEGPKPTVWGVPGLLMDVLDPVPFVPEIATDQRSPQPGNDVPTMPFQLPTPKGVGGSWFEETYRSLTRAHARVRQGRLTPACAVCCDTGFYVQRTSIAYDRSWLTPCTCGLDIAIPDLPDFVPAKVQGYCLMCEGNGWVYGPDVVWTGLRYEQVSRCYSCRRNT